MNKAKLVCVPCGKEVIIDSYGACERTIWCCGEPMKKVAHAKSKKAKKTSKKTSKKKSGKKKSSKK